VRGLSSTRKDGTEPAASLLSRLSMGQRPEISRKEMLKLTSKNYENLPEVKSKRKEDNKKADLKERKQKVKELEEKRLTYIRSK